MDTDTKNASIVVKKYFKCMAEENVNEELSLLTSDFKKNHSVGKDSDIKSIKLISIKEASDNYKEDYSDKENTKIFIVKFDIQFKDDNKSVVESGVTKWTVTVIRKDKTSPWLIADVGVC